MEFNFELVLNLVGYLVRFLGLLVFGVATSWFTFKAYFEGEKSWQLQVAVFLGFLAMAAVLVRYATPGAVGAYALGAGVALLIWGLRGEGDEEEEEKGKKKK